MTMLNLDALAAHARDAGRDAAMMARLAGDLPGFLRRTISTDDARQRVGYNLALREARLLTSVERVIFRHARSPYLALLRHVGCELGDFRTIVSRDGIDAALKLLADQGVYLSFDEMKGRREVVRGSFRRRFVPEEFDNPTARTHFLGATGGSGGRPSRLRHSLTFFAEWAASIALVFEAHRLTRPRMVFWYPFPLAWMIVTARSGIPSLAWFYPVHPVPVGARVLAAYASALARLAGRRFPSPERCDLSSPATILDRLTRFQGDDSSLVVLTMPSAATRLSLEASRRGHDLRDVTFVLLGEPVTDARRSHIEASGAGLIVNYSSGELSGLSYACAAPTAPDDVHLMLDRFAVVQRPRPAVPGGPIVDALLVTSLSPAATKIALNLEIGDYARLEERECGCSLGALGMRTHLSGIRSFEKLTGEGVTFARGNLERIVEEMLPARFGGSSVDYQLAEEEAPNGITRLVLRVNPAVGAVDEPALREALLAELGRDGPVSQYQAGMWRGAGTVEIRRQAPLATRAGKVLPFQLLRRAEDDARRL